MGEPLSKCKDDKVLVKRGRNRWVIARTDRDAASREAMIQTLGAFLSKEALGPASPAGSRGLLEVIQDPEPESGSLAAWFIGAARPVLLRSMSHGRYPPIETAGQELGDYLQCEPLRGVKSQDGKAFYFIVDFDWRYGDTWIPWPARKIGALGTPGGDEVMDLDWLLISAHFLSAKPLSPDSSTVEEIADEVKEKAEDVAEAIGDTGKKVLFAAVGVLAAVILFKVATNDGRERRAY